MAKVLVEDSKTRTHTQNQKMYRMVDEANPNFRTKEKCYPMTVVSFDALEERPLWQVKVLHHTELRTIDWFCAVCGDD